MTDLFVVKRTLGRRSADSPSSGPDSWTVVRIVSVILAVAAALWLAYELGTLILLLVFSVLFAYLVAPLVGVIQRRLVFSRERELPRGLAIGAAYLAVFGVVVLLLMWVAPHVGEAARQAPDRMRAATSGQPFDPIFQWAEHLGVSGAFIDRVVSMATGTVDIAARRIGTALLNAASYLPWLVLVPILAFFLLKDGDSLTRAATRLLPPRLRAYAPELLERIDAALAAYIRAQLVACVLIGVIVGVGFAVLRVPFASVLGVAAGIAEFVPLVGPSMIAVVSAAVAATHAPITVLWVLLFLAVLRVIQDYVFYPRLIGSNVHLHPLAVILAVLAGAELGGVVGVLLAVPALAAGFAAARYVTESRQRDNSDDLVPQTPRQHSA